MSRYLETFLEQNPDVVGPAEMTKAAPQPHVPERSGMDAAGDAALALTKGTVGAVGGLVGLADLLTPGNLGKWPEDRGVDFAGTQERLAQQYSPAQQAAYQELGRSEGIMGKARAVTENPSLAALSVLESLPLVAAGGAIGRAAGAVGLPTNTVKWSAQKFGPEIGAVARGAIGEGAITAGTLAEGIRQETPGGVTSYGQDGLALLGGTLTGAFGALGGKIQARLGISDVDVMAAGGSVTRAAANKGMTQRMIEGALAEGVIEELPQSVQEQVVQNLATGKPALDGIDEAAVLGVASGGIMGAGANIRAPKRAAAGLSVGATDVLDGGRTAEHQAPDGPTTAQQTPLPDTLEAYNANGIDSEGVGAPVAQSQAVEQGGVPEISGMAGLRGPGGAAGPVDATAAGGIGASGGGGVLDAAESDQPSSGLILMRDGKPYPSERAAKVAVASKKLSASHDVVPYGDGFALWQKDIDSRAVEAATSPQNDLPHPTQAQKDAGNYKKGHVRIKGMEISIENPAGSVRSGVDADGTEWDSPMLHHYGYIRGTKGFDKDHLDVFVAPGAEGSEQVFVVDQLKADGSFDEHKVIIGASSEAEALDIYTANYEEGWDRAGAVTAMPVDEFKQWAKSDAPARGALAYRSEPAPNLAAEEAVGQPGPTGTTNDGTGGIGSVEAGPGQPVSVQAMPIDEPATLEATGTAVVPNAPRVVVPPIASAENDMVEAEENAVPNVAQPQTAPSAESAAMEPAAPELVKVRSVYGETIHVRRSDLDNENKKLLPVYSANGNRKPGSNIIRENVDLSGEKVRELAEEAKGAFPVVTNLTGGAFQTEAAAKGALQRKGFEETHVVVPASRVKEGEAGFVGVIKGGQFDVEKPESAAMAPAATEAEAARERVAPDAGALTRAPAPPADFDLAAAERAYSGTSFQPKRAAEVELRQFEDYMANVEKSLRADAAEGSDVDAAIGRIRQAYLSNRQRVFSVREGALSSLVAGGSKFNSKQAGKRSDAVDRAEARFSEAMKLAVAREEQVLGVSAAREAKQAAKAAERAERKRQADLSAKQKRAEEIKLTIINEPENAHPITSEEWSKTPRDYKSVAVGDGYRYRSMMVNGSLVPVYLTDKKVIKRPQQEQQEPETEQTPKVASETGPEQETKAPAAEKPAVDTADIQEGDSITVNLGGKEYDRMTVRRIMKNGDFEIDWFGTKYIKPSEVLAFKKSVNRAAKERLEQEAQERRQAAERDRQKAEEATRPKKIARPQQNTNGVELEDVPSFHNPKWHDSLQLPDEADLTRAPTPAQLFPTGGPVVFDPEGYPDAVSNGHFIDLNGKGRFDLAGREAKEATFGRLIPKDIPPAVFEPALMIDEKETTNVKGKKKKVPAAVVLRNGDTQITVNQIYYRHFASRYKGAEFHADLKNPEGLVSVVHNGKLVGVLMPIRNNGVKLDADLAMLNRYYRQGDKGLVAEVTRRMGKLAPKALKNAFSVKDGFAIIDDLSGEVVVAPTDLADGAYRVAGKSIRRHEDQDSLPMPSKDAVVTQLGDTIADRMKQAGAKKDFQTKGSDGSKIDRNGWVFGDYAADSHWVYYLPVGYSVLDVKGGPFDAKTYAYRLSLEPVRMPTPENVSAAENKAFIARVSLFRRQAIENSNEIFTGELKPDGWETFGEWAGRGSSRSLDVATETEKAAEVEQQEKAVPDKTGDVASGAALDGMPSAGDTTAESGETDHLSAHDALMDGLRSGKVSLAEYKEAFAATLERMEEIEDAFSAMTKEAIFKRMGPHFRMVHRNDKKGELASAAAEDILGDFTIGRGLTIPFASDFRAASRRALVALVEGTTEKDLQDFAGQVQKDAAEFGQAVEARGKAIADPQTLDDYVLLLRSVMKESGKNFRQAYLELEPEQRAAYDRLSAEKSRKERGKSPEQVGSAAKTTTGEIIETKHTKTGEPLFVVQAGERVEREVYNQWNATARKLGGWYSSYRAGGAVPGFQFKTGKAAEAFRDYLAGETGAAQQLAQDRRDAFQDDRSQSAVERLNEMADRLDENAEAVLSADRKTNTARRAAMASRAEAAANADKALAQTMRNIAAAIEDGSASMLDRVRAKTQVELLSSLTNLAQDAALRQKYATAEERDRHRNDRVTADTASHAEFPRYEAFRSDLAALARKLIDNDGTKKIGQRLLKVADDVTDAYLKFAKENTLRVSQFMRGDALAEFASREDAERAIKKAGLVGKAIVLPVKRGQNRIVLSPSEAIARGLWDGDSDKRLALREDFAVELIEAVGRRTRGVEVPWQLQTAHERVQALKRLGIESPAELRAALREFIALREGVKEPDRVKQLEREMVGRQKDGLDFFPTPAGVADQLVEAAAIEPGMSVLEPSAGMGHIAERIRESGVEPEVIELSGKRRELLEAKGFNVIASDFMETQQGVGYDRIIMNPPFSDRRDAEHVRHAYDLLRPGGRLVAIMGEGVFFGQDKKAQAFRDWLDEVGGTSEKLEDGTFLDPSLPVNTAVSARMVVVDKPASAGSAMHSRTESPKTGNTVANVLSEITGRYKNGIAKLTKSGKLKIVQSVEGLPGDAKATGVSGVYFDGTIHLVADQIVKGEAVDVLRHEGLHLLMEQDKTFSAKKDALIVELKKARKIDKAVREAYGKVPQDTPAQHVDHEAMAYLVQHHKEHSLVKRLLAAVKAWLVRHGFPVGRMNAADFVALAEQGLMAHMRQDGSGFSTMNAAPAYSNSGILEVDGKKRPATNSDGRPIHATEEGTRNFWRWFDGFRHERVVGTDGQGGDNGGIYQADNGVALDGRGRPVVFYHGTSDDIVGGFDLDHPNRHDSGWLGDGVYVANSAGAANSYANIKAGNGYPNVLPLYVAVHNPYAAPKGFKQRLRNMTKDEIVKITNRLKALGHDGVVMTHYDGSKELVVFNSKAVKSAIGNDGRFGQNNNDIRYAMRRPSGGVGPAPSMLDRARPQVKNTIDYLRMKFQDKFIPLRNVQKQLEERGWVKNAQNDAYRAEELFHGKAAARLEDFYADRVEPLLDKIKESGVSIEAFESFLYATYAPQRNAHIAKINPDFPDGGSGMTNAEAASILAGFSASEKAIFRGLAQDVRDITKMQRDIIRAEGLELEETMDEWEAANPDYVPLKGGKKDKGRGIGTGFNVRRSGTRQALGRKSRAENILAELFSQAGATIVRAEKARVGRAFLQMVEEVPDRARWKVYDPKRPETMPTSRKLTDNPDVKRIARKIDRRKYALRRASDPKMMATLEGDILALSAELAVTRNRIVRDVMNPSLLNDENVMAVTREDGTVVYIDIMDDDLARVMKNLTPNQHGKVTRALGAATRYLARMSTSLNPEFVVTNMMRDLQEAMIHLGGERGRTVAAQTLRKVCPAMLGIRNVLRSGDKTSEWARWYERYRKAGAEVSFMDLRGTEEWENKLRAVANDSLYGKTKNSLLVLGNAIADYNTAVENAVRLAAFRTLIENGATEEDAASAAKNLTVNFNRKGELGPAMNALYMFFNAGVQGSARVVGALATSKNVRRIAGATMVMAFGLAEMNRMIGGAGDDDEDRWDKVSDYTKQTNLVFLTPDGDEIKIRLPYGYNLFVAAGYAMSDALHHAQGDGGKSPMQNARFITSAAMNAFNPFGGDEGLMKMLAPTLTDPLVEIATNENFMGERYMPENNPFGAQKPDSELYFRNVSGASRAVTRLINEATGGSKWEPGLVDVSPETIDHLFSFAFGGLGRTAGRVADIPRKAIEGDLTVRDIPFLRQVYGNPSPHVDLDRFYDNIARIDAAKKTASEIDGARRAEYIKSHPEIGLAQTASFYTKRLSELRRARNRALDMGDRERARQIERAMQETAVRFNRRANEGRY